MAFTTVICSFTAVAFLVLATSSVKSYPFRVYPTLWYGSRGGFQFNDYTSHGLSSSSVTGVDKIYIHYDSTHVQAILFTYRQSNGSCVLGYYHGHGTEFGGSDSIISLSSDEYIARISGRFESTIRSMHFVIRNSQTGRTRSYSYGQNRGQHFTIAGPIYAIYGYSGSQIDTLGVYLSTPTSSISGYIHGTGFWDPVTSHVPAITRLYKVCIRHGSHIDAVQFTYLTTIGTYTTGRYGGSGGVLACFTLASSERITTMQVQQYKHPTLDGIVIGLKFTISQSNSFRTYGRGPYGDLSKQYGSTSTIHMHSGVLGFYGHYITNRLSALGLIGH